MVNTPSRPAAGLPVLEPFAPFVTTPADWAGSAFAQNDRPPSQDCP